VAARRGRFTTDAKGCGGAGLFGGATAKTSILLTQALPAAIALALLMLSSRRASSGW
jgi:hypothetical protein